MREPINLTRKIIFDLDKMFEENPQTTAAEIFERFSDDFEEVPHIGRFPAHEAEAVAKAYGDYVEFLMANDGNSPDQLYTERVVDETAAVAITEFYRIHKSSTLRSLAKFLYRSGCLNFSNVTKCQLVPMSAKHVEKHLAKRTWGSRLYKPRYFQILVDGEPIPTCGPAIIQPDRRKNVFLETFGSSYLLVNPWTLLTDV